jgi:sialate O-acetylesterase
METRSCPLSLTKLNLTASLLVALLSAGTAVAAAVPAALFGDHMVLQRGQPLPVWGKADAGERVTVTLAGQTQTATADAQGNWRVTFPAINEIPAQPLEMRIESAVASKLVIRDILVGEVWICSGQSNMEWGMDAVNNAKQEIAAATDPQLRLFHVPRKATEKEQTQVDAKWAVCSPTTVPSFSAVGYFFGRHLRGALNVPIGLIESSVGGTPAEAWTDRQTLKEMPALADILQSYERALADYPAAREKWTKARDEWRRNVETPDPGNTKFANGWARSDFDDASWKMLAVPGAWEKNGGPSIDGVVWFRRSVDVPQSWAGQDLMLHLGRIDDGDTTYFNGEQIGQTPTTDLSVFADRRYTVPSRLVKSGQNVIAVRIHDRRGDGGFISPAEVLELGPSTTSVKPLPLAGQWKYAVELGGDPKPLTPPPPEPMHGDYSWAPSNLYNAMIRPLQPFAIKGAIWYQGESNAAKARQYEALLSAMIAGWRRAWAQPVNRDFPFLIVQLANFNAGSGDTGWPEVREAQANVARKLANCGLAVTIDIGEHADIHPRNKQDVGKRLGLQAEKVAYGRDVAASGPTFNSLRIDGSRAIVTFDHADGLSAKDHASPTDFELAGAEGKFSPAVADILGTTVVVHSDAVPQPQAVRYGWAASPQPVPNLYNGAGLPAVPFRSDAGNGATK